MPSLSAPDFWTRRGPVAQLMRPISWGYAAAAAARQAWTRPWQAPVPVICVGNLVAGGAGKTPVAMDLARRLTARGHRVHLLSRGYGGRIADPQQIDASRHTAADVGDEPLLLAEAAPTWIARDRVAGARAAIAAGAAALVLDDGLQNPTLAKDLSFLVIDGGYGLGNRLVLPAGPLRQSLAAGLALADAVVLLGADERGVTSLFSGKIVLQADLVAVDAEAVAGKTVVAFAGMGRPAKFFATLETIGARLIACHAFADHHPYAAAELERLHAEALAAGALLVTTAKDAVRLSEEWRRKVTVLAVAVAWRDEAALDAVLERVLSGRHHG